MQLSNVPPMFNFELPRRVMALIARCDREDLLDKLMGLSLRPEYQSNHLRILTLIHVTLVRAAGQRRVSCTELASLLNGLRDHGAHRNEDPAEDVFVSTVSIPDGEYRIFNGLYPAADFSLQRMIDAVLSQEFTTREHLTRQCEAILILSNAIAERCGLDANDFADSDPWQTQWPVQLPPLIARGRSARFSKNDLSALGINADLLKPFIASNLDDLLDAPFGRTILSRCPLVSNGSGLVLPVPSLVSPALRLHLARAVAHKHVPHTAVAAFHQSQFARWLSCDLPVRGNRPLLNDQLSLPVPDFDLPGDYAHAVVRFDLDKLAHLVLIEADWSKPPKQTIDYTHRASAAFERALASHLRHSRDALIARQAPNAGLTLVLYDSPGWNLNFDVGTDLASDWYVVGMTSYQFSMLLADPLFSLLDMWKMLREERRMSELGVRFMAWPDMLNYWSIWRGMHGTFWRRDIDLRKFGSYAPDTSQIQRQVATTRTVQNKHATPTITGEWRRVERWVDVNAPSSEYEKSVYLDPIAIVIGELRSVIETDHGSWWVATARPPFDPEDRRYLYLLWQAATEWLLILANKSREIFGDRRGTVEIRLLPVPPSIADAPNEIEFVPSDDSSIVTIVLPPSFIEGLGTVDNNGEKMLVRALAMAAVKAFKLEIEGPRLDAWVFDVTHDPALKMMHMTLSADVGLAIDLVTERVQFRTLQPPDLAAAELHFRDSLSLLPETGVSSTTNSVEGPTAVMRVLHSAVDIRWSRCRDLLRELDRGKLLTLTSRIIEALHRHRVDAERSALSRSRLYADSQDIDVWPAFTMGQRDAAFRAYRVLSEMALCEAALTHGRDPGLSDVDTLSAEITFLIREADLSDAIRFGLVEPRITFQANGSFSAKDGGAETFMNDYLIACLGESVAQDIDNYPQLYEDAVEASNLDDLDVEASDPFLTAFEEEFGIALENVVRISNALQNIALNNKTDVIQMTRSAIEKRLTNAGIGNDLFDPFLRAFGLSSRPAWEIPPSQYRADDIWPWFFERRLSLMLRPIMIMSPSADPVMIFGVRQLDMGMRYASTLFELGVWPKEKLTTTAAKAYVDNQANHRGKQFEDEVFMIVKKLGWRAFRGIPMSRFGASKKLGDLDVLAVSPDGAVWIVVECKWFGAARTPREVANWIQDYRGRGGDKLDRHLQRCTWVQSNVNDVIKALHLSPPTKVVGRIVTTSPVPLAFSQPLAPNATVWTRRELSELLKSFG